MDDELIISDDIGIENLDSSILPFFSSSEIKHFQESCESSMKKKPKILTSGKTELHFLLDSLSYHDPYVHKEEVTKEIRNTKPFRKRRKELFDDYKVLAFPNSFREEKTSFRGFSEEEEENFSDIGVSDYGVRVRSRSVSSVRSRLSSIRSRETSRNSAFGFSVYAGTDFFFNETVEELIEEFDEEMRHMWFMRDRYLRQLAPNGLLNLIEDEYIKVGIITYNMKGSIPPLTDPFQQTLFPSDTHHIYAVGTQECETSFVKSIVGKSNKERWVDNIIKSISMRYVPFTSSALASQHLVIFVRKELKRYIQNVEVYSIQAKRRKAVFCKPWLLTKIGGEATIIGFEFGRTNILFINCYLTKGVNNLRRRNQECLRILKYIGKKKKKNIYEFYDHIFFFGDLNYRLTLSKDKMNLRAVIAKCIEVGMPEVIANQDQLIHQKRRHKVLNRFREGDIKFNPTFKFLGESNIYDDKKFQCYPDRILYFTKPQVNSRLLEYNALLNFPYSTHRPVYARFLIEVDATPLEPPEDNVPDEPKKVEKRRHKKKYFSIL